DIFRTLEHEARSLIYTWLSPKEFAAIFENLDIQDQKLFFLEMDQDYSSSMFDNLFTDDVVQFLTDINKQWANEILQQMNANKAKEVEAILAYTHETAGAIMTNELISIPAASTVGDVLEKLRNEAPDAEIIYYLYVVDTDHELVGVVSLRDLIIASPDVVIQDIMSTRVVSVHDVLDILEEETTEDFGEISAAKGATDVGISPFEAAKKRSPWIILLMVLGLITGSVIESFEETLESVVLLAFFIPMIMDSGG